MVIVEDKGFRGGQGRYGKSGDDGKQGNAFHEGELLGVGKEMNITGTASAATGNAYLPAAARMWNFTSISLATVSNAAHSPSPMPKSARLRMNFPSNAAAAPWGVR